MVGLLHKGALWAGQQLDTPRPLPTTGGPRPEENYLILPDLCHLGFPLHVPVSVVIPQGALLNWRISLPGKHLRTYVAQTARNPLPRGPALILWAGGQRVATKDDEIVAATNIWFKEMEIPHEMRNLRVRSATYRPVNNGRILNKRRPFVPDQYFGRAIPPPLSRKEQEAFSREEQK